MPAPHGAGKRSNAGLRHDRLAHLRNIDCRSVASASGATAKAHAARNDKCGYQFPTKGRSCDWAAAESTKRCVCRGLGLPFVRRGCRAESYMREQPFVARAALAAIDRHHP